MIAAIYARKSTEQTGMADDAKSVTRQIENARAFAVRKGWTVPDECIYVDDGISGAAISKLQARQRMLDTIYSEHAPFQILIVQKSDRLSRRDGDEAFGELKRIARAGVQVWFYSKGERFTHGDFKSNVTGFLEAEFNAEFRRAIAEKTYEAMARKARAGHVTGGRVFGYTNVRANGHVVLEINEAEAAVVLRMFEMAASGLGLKKIAHTLNAERVPAPRPQQGRVAGWAPSSVRAVLLRQTYRGRVVWNRTKKRDAGGEQKSTPRAEADWIEIDAPQLRIVPAEIAEQVDHRFGDKREKYLRSEGGRLIGRPGAAKFLLTGLLRCPCGGHFEAQTRRWGAKSHPGGVYGCSVRIRKGAAACSSTLALPIAATDLAVLDIIEREMLDPELIERLVDSAFVPEPDDERPAMQAERVRLAREIENLTTAIAAGGDLAALVGALKDRDRRLKALDARLVPRPQADRERLRAALEQRIGDWCEALREHVPQARQVLRQILGPIEVVIGPAYLDHRPTFAVSEERLYQAYWRAEMREAALLQGLITRLASPTGFEPVF